MLTEGHTRLHLIIRKKLFVLGLALLCTGTAAKVAAKPAGTNLIGSYGADALTTISLRMVTERSLITDPAEERLNAHGV